MKGDDWLFLSMFGAMAAIVSVVDGGYIGWWLSRGSRAGAIVGIVVTAVALYGEIIYGFFSN